MSLLVFGQENSKTGINIILLYVPTKRQRNVVRLFFVKSDESSRAVARTLIGGGGRCIFIYSGSARLTSFEINFITKETSRARPEYMNIHPPPPQLTL